MRFTGNGAVPTWELTQLGVRSVAPFRPQQLHFADFLSISLDASTPQRMMNGASATGAL
jgi:hypothetical protein